MRAAEGKTGARTRGAGYLRVRSRANAEWRAPFLLKEQGLSAEDPERYSSLA